MSIENIKWCVYTFMKHG